MYIHPSTNSACEDNAKYMFANCAAVCRQCHLFDYDARCPSDPDEPFALSEAGELNKLFERILTTPEFEKFGLKVLSQPNPPTDDILDGPWVVTMDTFLSDAESDRLIQMGDEIGYMESKHFIANKTGNARTSKQAFCSDDACSGDLHMQAVDARIQALTGIPSNHSEYFQMLKYAKGEYYRSHNDYNPAHLQVQTGVRILTVFLYLNNVQAGGATEFPDLGIAVTPQKGKAVIWPSVLNEDPHAEDSRTLHQALPVEMGEKYGANVWIHQREYRKQHDKGCTYAKPQNV